ncbi:MAG: hypothetical protein ACRENP_02400 [Longimicrobiales bacterium]
MWHRLEADGCIWEVRVVANEAQDAGTEILEFRPAQEATRPPRRLAVDRGALDNMNDAALQAAYRQARPIGGDFYGRPGKRMPDAN